MCGRVYLLFTFGQESNKMKRYKLVYDPLLESSILEENENGDLVKWQDFMDVLEKVQKQTEEHKRKKEVYIIEQENKRERDLADKIFDNELFPWNW